MYFILSFYTMAQFNTFQLGLSATVTTINLKIAQSDLLFVLSSSFSWSNYIKCCIILCV